MTFDLVVLWPYGLKLLYTAANDILAVCKRFGLELNTRAQRAVLHEQN